MSEEPKKNFKKLPSALTKALEDRFDYAMGLRNGQVIHFCEARLSTCGKWVELLGEDGTIEMSCTSWTFPRGLFVRLKDIVWVADAPMGS